MSEDVRGEMRLKPAYAKRKAHVTDVARDVVVDGANSLEIGMRIAGKLLGFGADFRARNAAFKLEAGVPGRDLGPIGERSNPDAPGIQPRRGSEQRLDVRETIRGRERQGPFPSRQVGGLPGPDVTITLLAQLGAVCSGG